MLHERACPLACARKARLWPLRVQPRERVIELLLQRLKLACHALREAPPVAFEQPREIGGIGHEQFRCGRRRRRAQIRDEIGDREVDLMADRRDDRDRARMDRARHRLVVERPEVLERAAAARQQQHVVARGARCFGDDTRDDRWRLAALHRDREQFDVRERKTPRDHAEHVADRGATGRSHDANTAREARQRSLARRIEQAFRREPRLQKLELAPERAFAGFLEMLDDELKLAARFIQRDAPACDDVHAVGRLEAQPRAARLEHRAADECGRVLQRKVEMAGARAREVRDFAFEPDQRQRVFDEVAREAVQRRGRQDFAGGNGRIGFGHDCGCGRDRLRRASLRVDEHAASA